MPINKKMLSKALKANGLWPLDHQLDGVVAAYEQIEKERSKLVEAAGYWIRNTVGIRIAREDSCCVKMMVLLAGCDVEDAVEAMQQALNDEVAFDDMNNDLPF